MDISDYAWYNQRGEQAANTVTSLTRALYENDTDRRLDVERNVSRFSGKQLLGLGQSRAFFDVDGLNINLTKAVVETISAKVGKNRPRPTLLTYGGDFALKNRVEKLQRWIDGVYNQADVYSTLPIVFRDAMLAGTGVWHFFPDVGRKRLCVERVFPLELLIDPVDGVDGDPRCLYRIRFLDKDALKAFAPSKARRIEELQTVASTDLPNFLPIRPDSPVANRMVMLCEAWKRAEVGRDGKVIPGRHVLASGSAEAGGLAIVDEPWERCDFPFAFFHWCKPVTGFWGEAAVTEIRPVETEYNRLMQSIQKAMDLCGKPWILNPEGAHVKTSKFSNDTGVIINYEGGVPPTIQTFSPVHPQVVEQAAQLYNLAFQVSGTNELQASATKPAGIESGRALQQLSEEHLVRFATITQHFEDVVTREFCKQFMHLAEELNTALSDRGGYVLRAVSGKSGVRFAWNEVQMDPDDFFVECWPTSVLPHTPSGRTDAVQQWQANGWLNGDQAKLLLDFPDLDSVRDIATADQKLLDSQLEQMLTDGKDVVPDQRQNLQQALTWGTFAYLNAQREGASQEALDRVSNFLDACQDLLNAAKAAAAPLAPPPGAMPGNVAPPPGMMPSPIPPGPPGL